MDPTKEAADSNIAMWAQAEKNAHEQASVAINEAGAATEKLQAVRKELAIAEKQLAEIRATIREVTKLASQ